MLGLLGDLVELFENIPQYILFAIETMVNTLSSGIEALFILSQEALGSLPEPSAPEFIAEINWFFPIGLILGIAAPILAGYITFVGVKYIFKKVGAL